jgi:hypothetical protein
MSDPRFDPRRSYDLPPYRRDEQVGSIAWLPITIAGGIIAAIVLFAIAVPRDQTNPVQADRPAISTDLDTTGRSVPK